MKNSELLSIILLSYYSNEQINVVHKKVVEEMEKEKIPFEFIIIDDGSEDDSFEFAKKLEDKDKRVSAYQLSRNFTSHYARFAGLSVCKGDCVTFIPDDFQMPLETVVKMYRLWQKNNKIVVPFRAYRKDGKLNDFFSNTYYNIMNRISDVKFPNGGADGMLIDREIVNILNTQIKPRNTSTIVEVLRLGFDPVFIPYIRPSVDSESRWTLKKKIKLASDTILSSSSFPIKMITGLGLFSVVIAFLFILFIIVIKLTVADSFLGLSVPGWASSFVLISFFSGLILFSLGIIAEYIWRIHEEVKGRPGFIIKSRDDKVS